MFERTEVNRSCPYLPLFLHHKKAILAVNLYTSSILPSSRNISIVLAKFTAKIVFIVLTLNN